ncbi:MAG: hypothetical protein ACYTFW_18965 [Planctomycetota bacterium]
MSILNIVVIVALLWGTFAVPVRSAEDMPRLILQITIDQMRGDFPMRYKDRLGEGEFRYLMEKGIHYINARALGQKALDLPVNGPEGWDTLLQLTFLFPK